MDASGGQQAPEPAAGLQAPLDLLSPPLPPAPLLPAPPSAPLDGLPEGLDDAQKQWMQQWMAQQMQTVAQQQQQQQHWQHSPSTQQTAAPPADVPQFAWPIVLERAEVQLRAIQRRKQALVKLLAELQVVAAEVTSYAAGLEDPATAQAMRLAQLPPRPPGRIPGGRGRHQALESIVAQGALRAVQPEPAAAAGAQAHDPATCTMPGCLWCAHSARLAQSSAARSGTVSPPSQPTKQLRARRQRRASSAPAAADEAAAALSRAVPGLDMQVCTAICQAFSGDPGGQQAMAAWCSMSGARTAAELATVLDSSQQVWGMALSATHGAGVRLVHWVALLNTCRALAKQ